MEISDKKLVDFCSVKEVGLQYFMSKYGHSLRYFAYTITHDKHVAEEIVSDSFFKLWNGRAKVKTEQNIKAFLYLATRNACFDHVGKATLPLNSEGDELPEISSSDTDILNRIISVELVELLIVEIEKLPEQQAEVFRLTYLEGLSTQEICERLGTTASNVYFARSKALNTLRKVLEGKGLKYYSAFLLFIGLDKFN